MSKRPLHSGTGISKRDRERRRLERWEAKARLRGMSWEERARQREERNV